MARRQIVPPCPWTLAIVVVAVTATALFLATGESAQRITGMLVATREGLFAGEGWRLVTGPFVHGTVEHLLRDTIALLVLGAFAERLLGRLFLPIVCAALILPTLVVLVVPPTLDSYFGLSGVVHALLVAIIVREVRQARGRLRLGLIAIAALYAANLAFEMVTGGLLFPHRFGDGFRPVPFAHLVGAAIGLAAQLKPIELANRSNPSS